MFLSLWSSICPSQGVFEWVIVCQPLSFSERKLSIVAVVLTFPTRLTFTALLAMMSLSSDKRRSEIQAWGVYLFLRMSNLGLAFDFRWQLNYGFPLCSKCRPPVWWRFESISWWNCVSFPWKCFLFVKSAENFLIQCLVKSSRVFPRVEIFFWKSACFIYDLQAVRTDNFSVNLFPWALFSGVPLVLCYTRLEGISWLVSKRTQSN